MKVIGLCNVPMFIKKKIAEALNVSVDAIDFDYVGLNHLSWFTDIRIYGKTVLNNLVEEGIKIKLANMSDFPVDDYLVKTKGFLPSPYLKYYYHHDSIFKNS
jgi:6-phospho-beta-glucosidase